MAYDDNAEILDAEEVHIDQSRENPNKTQQVINLISVNPTVNTGIPGAASSRLNKDSVNAIINFYNEMNQQYGFTVEYDITDIMKNFSNIVEEVNLQVFEVYVSEGFKRFRVVFFQKAMIAIADLLDQVTNPALLSDSSMTIEYKYGMMTQLMNLLQQVTAIYEQVKVDDPKTVLRAIKTKEQNNSDDLVSDPVTARVVEQLRNIALKEKK